MALPWNLTAIFACICASYYAVRRLFLHWKRYFASRSAPDALAKSAAAANN